MSTFITIDHDALKADAEKLLHGSPLWAQIQGGLILDIHHPGVAAATLGQLVQNAIASVEIVKQNALHMEDPDGSKGLKIDNTLILDVAVDVLHDAVKWGGVFGPILSAVDKPLLVFLIEVGLAAYRGKDWLAVARTILTLA